MGLRRQIVLGTGAIGLTASLPAFAQPRTKVWIVGLLLPRERPASLETDHYGQIPRGMRDLGYVEGRNVRYEWRFADGHYDRLPGLAAELVRLNVDVIVASSTPSTRAAQQATRTIPIVMVGVGDPLASGFVASLARPGGNITGMSILAADSSPKLLDFLVETIPELSRICALMNPANPVNAKFQQTIQASSHKAKIPVAFVEARTAEEIDRAFFVMMRENAQALIVMLDPLFIQQRHQIVELAAKARLPAIYQIRQFAEAGGLMSYGQDFFHEYHRVAKYVDKILKGAMPSELPVEQATKLELLINLKTAKSLGITIPLAVLLRADRVIE